MPGSTVWAGIDRCRSPRGLDAHSDLRAARCCATWRPSGFDLVSVHLQPAYRGRIALSPAGCRATEAAAREVVRLPMHSELVDADVKQVSDALRS